MYRVLRDQVDAAVPRLDFRVCSAVLGAVFMVAALPWLLASILSENAVNNPDGPVKMDLSCPRWFCPMLGWNRVVDLVVIY